MGCSVLLGRLCVARVSAVGQPAKRLKRKRFALLSTSAYETYCRSRKIESAPELPTKCEEKRKNGFATGTCSTLIFRTGITTGRRRGADRASTDIEHTTNFHINTRRQVVLMEVVCSGGAPLITMMQPTNFRNRNDPSSVWRLDRSGFRAVFLQRQVCAAAMVIVGEAFEVSQ